MGQKLLAEAVEQLPSVLREKLSGCVEAFAGTGAEGSSRAGLLSMLLMDPEVLLWQLQAGMASSVLVVDDGEEDLWSQQGVAVLCEFSKFVPARRRKDGQAAAKPVGCTEMTLGSGTTTSTASFQGGLLANMTRCAAALRKSDLQRHQPVVWRRSELQQHVDSHFAVMHPLEALLAAHGQQMTLQMVQAASTLFGSLAYVAEADYREDWKVQIQPVYGPVDRDGEDGEAAAVVWDAQTTVYGRLRVGPAECPPTDPRRGWESASSTAEAPTVASVTEVSVLTATTAQDGWGSQAGAEVDSALQWALQESEREEARARESHSRMLDRVRKYAEDCDCGLVEVAADGDCLPSLVAYFRHGSVGFNHTVRSEMYTQMAAALQSQEEWAQHVLEDEHASFELPGRYGLLEHAIAAAHHYRWNLAIHLLPAEGVESGLEPAVRQVGPTPAVNEVLGDYAMLFDGVDHWYGLVPSAYLPVVTAQLTAGGGDASPIPRLWCSSGVQPDGVERWYALPTAGAAVESPSDSEESSDEMPEMEMVGSARASVVDLGQGNQVRDSLAGSSGEQAQEVIVVSSTDGSSVSGASDGDSWLLLREQGEDIARERFNGIKRELKESRGEVARLEDQLTAAQQAARDHHRSVTDREIQLEELRAALESLTTEHEEE